MTTAEIEKLITTKLTALKKSLIAVNAWNDFVVFKGKWMQDNVLLSQLKRILRESPRSSLIKIFGKLLNQYKISFNDLFSKKEAELKQLLLEQQLLSEKIDVSLKSKEYAVSSVHVLNQIKLLLIEFLTQFNFEIVSGNIVDSNLFNFEKLNIGKHHPAREDHDTFYLQDHVKSSLASNKKLLRTHCTNVTAAVLSKFMSTGKNEFRVASLGPVFRNDDDDATHSHQFTQLDVVCLATYNISVTHLKQLLLDLLSYVFEVDVKLRFRMSYFPFTEPSFEIDLACWHCDGTGCKICVLSGWIEILGAGMVHQNVLKNCQIDPLKYRGFAFGIGLERLAMVKHNITDIRSFYNNDYRFLSQFNY